MADRPGIAIRCDRCRATFGHVASDASTSVVQCPRCGLVFAARGLTALNGIGTLGGAAHLSVESPRQPSQPRRTPSLAVVAGGLLSGLLCVLLVASLVRRQSPAQLATKLPTASAHISQGEALLWLDDRVSLENAIAAFSTAESLDPRSDEARALRATAAMLLGLSLRSDLDVAKLVANTPPTREVIEQANRGELLLIEGSKLAIEVARATDTLSWPVQRAKMLADALNGAPSASTFQVISARHQSEPSPQAWESWTKAISLIIKSTDLPADDVVSKDLERALAASPHFHRAQWMLCAHELRRSPREVSKAQSLVDQLLRSNPRHELAKRLRDSMSLATR